MTKSVNQCYLTTMHSEEVILTSRIVEVLRCMTQYDPGSNVTIISDTLARELGILIIMFQATFQTRPQAPKECVKAS